MKTATICIGNSDNKLTQAEWAEFFNSVKWQISRSADSIFFSGCSNPDSIYQNACWVFSITTMDTLRLVLKSIKQKYKQDSIALVVGETEFI